MHNSTLIYTPGINEHMKWPDIINTLRIGQVALKSIFVKKKKKGEIVSHLITLTLRLGTVAYQAPLPMEFSREEYWSGLPFPPPRNLPNPGIQPRPPAWRADASLSEPPGKPISPLHTLLFIVLERLSNW